MILPDARRQVAVNIQRILLIVAFLAAWELLAEYKLVDTFFISKPSFILVDLIKLFVTGEILPHISVTLREALMGLFLGASAGIALAFVLGRMESVARILDPIIVALYGIPKLALGPLFILWFGLGIESKVFLSAIMVFFLVFFNTLAGFRSVEPALVDAVRLMGARESQVIAKVVFPACLPWILTGLRAGLGAAVLGAIVGEYIGANSGLGWMVEYAGGMYDITRVFSCIVILTLIMACLNGVLKIIEKSLLKWRPSAQ